MLRGTAPGKFHFGDFYFEDYSTKSNNHKTLIHSMTMTFLTHPDLAEY